VWAGPGRNDAALNVFFDELGPDRAAQLSQVSADMAHWIARVVARRAPNALRCADAFHVVAWAIDALDVERRRSWNAAAGRNKAAPGAPQRARSTGAARRSKRARCALWKNPEDLTDRQRHELDWIAKTDPRLWRAYLLKEGLRYVFAVKGNDGRDALDRWMSWARRSRLPAFIDLVRKINLHRAAIDATLEHRLSQGLVESTNTKAGVRGYTRRSVTLSMALLPYPNRFHSGASGCVRPAMSVARARTEIVPGVSRCARSSHHCQLWR
jgi:transposase